MKGRPRLAVVEFHAAHDLTFPLLATTAAGMGADLDIYLPHRLAERQPALPGRVRLIRIGDGRRAGTVLAIACRLRRGRYQGLWVNTAHGPRSRLLVVLTALLCGSRTIRLGVIHFTEKAVAAFSTRLVIASLHGLVVFSHFLRQSLPPKLHPKAFPLYPIIPPPRATEPDPARVRIIIPGAVDPNRRDYAALAEILAAPELDPRITFVLLGRCDRSVPAVAAWYASLPPTAIGSQHLVLWEDYVSDARFQEELSRASAVCLLMHPNCPQYRMFCEHQASGATYLGYARGLPLLVDQGMLPAVAEFGPLLVPYASNDKQGLLRAVNQLAQTVAAGSRRSLPAAADIRQQAAQAIAMLSHLARRHQRTPPPH